MIRRLIQGLVFNAIAVYAAIYFVDGISYGGGWQFFLAVGIIAGFLNVIIKPLLKLISLPFILLTGGLFLILINVAVFIILKLILDFLEMDQIMLIMEGSDINYVIGGLVFGVVNWLEQLIFHND